YMKANSLIFILCLLVAGMGSLSAGTPRKVKADKYGVKESASAQLLAKTKLREKGKVVFKCRVSQYNDRYMLMAKVLRNDSAVHIVSPGVKFMLADGDSVVLKAERPAACCSSWADGRWYNASFKMPEAAVEKLRTKKITSIHIPSDKGEIVRETADGKQDALAELIQSVEKD
ncbi:MAG: hypothetical protein Q4D36_10665, partial [Bacteroidales bacterium]|nr:hypothetical protein [Bacteroidales bacterium]